MCAALLNKKLLSRNKKTVFTFKASFSQNTSTQNNYSAKVSWFCQYNMEKSFLSVLNLNNFEITNVPKYFLILIP